MITVLMPTYNCAQFISDAIRSIINQTYRDFEFLIIDDGSNDGTHDVVSQFKDNRINYVYKKHSGFADSLNYGLKTARYDMIARMDADDISHPSRLKTQYDFLNANLDYDIISSWYAVFNNDKIKYVVPTFQNHSEIVKGLSLYSLMPHSGCLLRKEKILRSGGYYGEAFEDYSLWLKIMGNTKFYNIPKVLIFVRFRSDSLSRSNLVDKHKLIYSIQSPFYDNLDDFFGIYTHKEKNKVRGFREYFYGSPKLARKFWLQDGVNLLLDYRILLAYVVSFLPNKIFIKFKESRVRFRLIYLIKYFSTENKMLRNRLKASLQH